jgi:hypothetical protein
MSHSGSGNDSNEPEKALVHLYARTALINAT